MIDPNHKLSKERQRKALSLSKNALYYTPKGESDENLEMMKAIDRENTDHPEKGVLQMVDALRLLHFIVGPKRVRRLMRKMCIYVQYPRKSLSKGGIAKYVRPYLLRGLKISRPNQVWSIDITYIPMRHGFMYLTAIIDVFSRAIVAFGLHNTLDASNQVEVLETAVSINGAPEIINSDQGVQYTSELWEQKCGEYGIKISMDGKGRCKDNIWIERFWRTIKHDWIYLNPASDVAELRNGIRDFIEYYNHKRPHQGIGHRIPWSVYTETAA